MLTNATITKHERGTADAAGAVRYTDLGVGAPGDPGALPLRGLCKGVSRQAKWELGAALANAETQVRIEHRRVIEAIAIGDRLTIQVDGHEAVAWRVILVRETILGAVSSVMVYLGRI